MSDLISRQAAIDAIDVLCQEYRYKIPGKRETYSTYNEAWQDALDRAEGAIFNLPSAQTEIIRCKDCKHQEKFFHEDRRRKDGGHYIYGCELADGYSHVCLDDDFCSRGERRT